ncbi:MAG: hypothetical protein ACOCSJ_00505 [Candidatus Natronoplasma sp.]
MVDKNKTTGYVVFGLGIALLVVTFSLAIYTFLNPVFIEGFSDLVEVGDEGLAPLVDFLIYLIPGIFLFAMGSVAGKITKYGIQMIRSPERKTVIETERRRKTSEPDRRQTPPPVQSVKNEKRKGNSKQTRANDQKPNEPR